MGPSPGVQGELKELLRKLGRFSCYQGNLWKHLRPGTRYRRGNVPGPEDTTEEMSRAKIPPRKCPGPELHALINHSAISPTLQPAFILKTRKSMMTEVCG